MRNLPLFLSAIVNVKYTQQNGTLAVYNIRLTPSMADNKLNMYDEEARPSETAYEQKPVQDSPMVSKQPLVLLKISHTD